MSLEYAPERLTVATTHRTAAQRAPRRRSIVSRTCPAIAPFTRPETPRAPPWTLVRVTPGARAPRPMLEMRAEIEDVDVVVIGVVPVRGGVGVATGATGTGVS